MLLKAAPAVVFKVVAWRRKNNLRSVKKVDKQKAWFYNNNILCALSLVHNDDVRTSSVSRRKFRGKETNTMAKAAAKSPRQEPAAKPAKKQQQRRQEEVVSFIERVL